MIKLQAIATTNNIIMVAINALEKITVPSNIRLLELALLTGVSGIAHCQSRQGCQQDWAQSHVIDFD